ncbi:MAG: hypothetical protein OJF59_000146 [Cytophagales bacterium]|nr:MAG: hypothetical protein OJF59_000146 [Cytophagales bacterium]
MVTAAVTFAGYTSISPVRIRKKMFVIVHYSTHRQIKYSKNK